MYTNGFARRSASVVALLVFGLILAYSLPGTAETGIDSSPIEFSDAALEDVFVRIEDDVSIEPDLKTITIPKSVRVIEDSFNGCTALKRYAVHRVHMPKPGRRSMAIPLSLWMISRLILTSLQMRLSAFLLALPWILCYA